MGAELLLLIAVVAQFFCGMASVAANSRMTFAFSRDGAVPGHQLWHRINPRTRTPTNSIWFCVVFAFLLAVPSLWSSVAYAAVTSIATIGLYIAYVLPTLLRRIKGKSWEGGRWSLGKWSPLVGWVGIVWVAFIAVLFMLPEVAFSDINRDTFNYAPVAVGVVLLFSGGYWLISARKWFTGPKVAGRRDPAGQDRGRVSTTSSGSWPRSTDRLRQGLRLQPVGAAVPGGDQVRPQPAAQLDVEAFRPVLPRRPSARRSPPTVTTSAASDTPGAPCASVEASSRVSGPVQHRCGWAETYTAPPCRPTYSCALSDTTTSTAPCYAGTSRRRRRAPSRCRAGPGGRPQRRRRCRYRGVEMAEGSRWIAHRDPRHPLLIPSALPW